MPHHTLSQSPQLASTLAILICLSAINSCKKSEQAPAGNAANSRELRLDALPERINEQDLEKINKDSISEWNFHVTPKLEPVIIDPQKVAQPESKGTPGFTVNYAPDFLAVDIERRFYIEIQEGSKELPKLELSHSPSITYLDRNPDIVLIDELQPELEQDILGEPMPATLNSGAKHTMVKVRTGARRYYFKTTARDHGASVTFTNPKTQGSITVPIKIYDLFDMARTHHLLDQDTKLIGGGPGDIAIIPQIFPVGQGGQVLPFTKQKANLPKPTKNEKEQGKTALLEKTDTEIWNSMHDSGARLSISASFAKPNLDALEKLGLINDDFKPNSTDPIHGYQFFVDADGKRIPSNHIEADDFSSGWFPDDGFAPPRFHHRRVPLVHVAWAKFNPKARIHPLATLTFHRHRSLANLARTYADQYQRTGNPEYAYRGLVILSRIGLEMNFRSFMQQYRTKGDGDEINKNLSTNAVFRKLSLSVLFGVGLGETRTIQENLIDTYEKLFTGLDETSEQLVSFLQAQDLPIKNRQDAQWLIERTFLAWMQANVHKQSYFNFPKSHNAFIGITNLLGFPDSDPMLSILFDGKPGSHYPISSTAHMFDTEYTKDGVKSENIGGYNTGAVNGTVRVLNHLSDLTKLSKKYQKSPPNLKRLPNAVETNIDLALTPSVPGRVKWGMADFGQIPGSLHGSSYKIDSWAGNAGFPSYYGDTYGPDSDNVMLDAFKESSSPRIAWAFLNSGNEASLLEKTQGSGQVHHGGKAYPFTWENLREAASSIPANWRQGFTPVTSLNISTLRRGEGLYERALSIGGGATGRSLYDQMEIKLFGYRTHLISRSDVPAAITENAGRQWITDGSDLTGYSDLSANGKYFAFNDQVCHKFTKAPRPKDSFKDKLKSRYQTFPEEGWQRRFNALVDIDEKHFYLIDLYRMHGGDDHWRTLGFFEGDPISFDKLSLKKNPKKLKGNTISVLPAYGKSTIDIAQVRSAKDARFWTATATAPQSDGLSMKLHQVFNSGSSHFHVGVPETPATNNKPATPYPGQELLFWNHPMPKSPDAPYHSQLGNVIEFYGGSSTTAQIQSTRALRVSGEDELGFRPIGLEVKLPERTDYFIFSASSGSKSLKLPNGEVMNLTGRVAHAAFDKDQKELIHLELIGGTKLSCAGKSVHSVPELSGKITEADIDGNRITVRFDSKIPDNLDLEKNLVGKPIKLGRGQFLQNYRIVTAQPLDDRRSVVLQLHLPIVSVTSKITDVKADNLSTESLFIDWNQSIHGSRIKSQNGNTYLVDGSTSAHSNELIILPGAQGFSMTPESLKQDFTVGETLQLIDYYIGDTVSLPLSRGSK